MEGTMSDTDITRTADPVIETQLDEDDHLKREFVRDVLAAVEAGDDDGARTLVAPLHPADIADLIEQTPGEERRALVRSLSDLIDAEVIAEMNDYVREDLIDDLAPEQVADIAAELDTDDAVAIIEDMEEDDQRAVLRALAGASACGRAHRGTGDAYGYFPDGRRCRRCTRSTADGRCKSAALSARRSAGCAAPAFVLALRAVSRRA